MLPKVDRVQADFVTGHVLIPFEASGYHVVVQVSKAQWRKLHFEVVEQFKRLAYKQEITDAINDMERWEGVT